MRGHIREVQIRASMKRHLGGIAVYAGAHVRRVSDRLQRDVFH